MTKKETLKLFEDKKIRAVWDDEQEKWYFSIVDVIEVLTDSSDYQTARNYWKVLKNRLVNEGNQTVTNCNQLKMRAADGKMRMTDVAKDSIRTRQWPRVAAAWQRRHDNSWSRNWVVRSLHLSRRRTICCRPKMRTYKYQLTRYQVTRENALKTLLRI